MRGLAYDIATIRVLFWRELWRFGREPLRIIGVLLQPLLFWLVIGGGMSESFRLPGVDVDYLGFFFAGIVVLVVVFTSIFASVGVIEDKQQGFLQAVLAAPGSRAALIAGKTLATATLALVQASLFLLLAPVAGFSFAHVAWGQLLVTLVAASFALSALGIGLAWRLRTVQSYHALQMTLLVPLWVVSGAMFPLPVEPAWLGLVMRLNPIAYIVSSLRWALYGLAAPARVVVSAEPRLELGAVVAFAIAAFALALLALRRGPTS